MPDFPNLFFKEVFLMQQSNEYSTFPIDIEKLLADGNIIKIKPQGYSMYPLFIPGRDEACIEHVAFSSLKRDDVVLYRRDESILVLHRIWKITGDSFYMVGDNQTQIEGPLRADQVRGKMIGFVQNPSYRFFSSLWLFLRPIRPLAWKLMKQLRKAFKALTPTKKK